MTPRRPPSYSGNGGPPRRFNRGSGGSYGDSPYGMEGGAGRGDGGRRRSAAPGPGGPGNTGGRPGLSLNNLSLLAGVLVVGIGIGSFVTTTQSAGTRTGNIASSQDLDLAVPDPEFCKQWGASAYVMDVEMYQTMNPVSSFVTQPRLQPGCVIRRENWSVLQKEGVVTSDEMRQCKQRMNTFAYIGSIRDQPVVRCVYQTDSTENLFLGRNGSEASGLNPDTGRF